MNAVLIVTALAASNGPSTTIPLKVDFDLAKVRHGEANCADRGMSDDIVVCARKGMGFWIADASRFAAKPLRAEFTGPLNAETAVHLIQHGSSVATAPAAAVTFTWRF